MSNADLSSETGRGVFDDAARAADFVEEDTQVVMPPRRPRRSEQAAGESGETSVLVTELPPELRPVLPTRTAADAEDTSLPPFPAGAGSDPVPGIEDVEPARRPDVSEVAALFSGASSPENAPAPARARTGVRGVLARVGLPIAPSAAEKTALMHEASVAKSITLVRQTTWTRAVSVLVANPKGGVGKTPISLLLGGVLASIRGGSVAIVEFSDDPGALGYRAEGNPELGLGELIRDVGTITSRGQLSGYTAPQSSFASVIGSTGRRARLTGEAVAGVSALLDDYYSIRVMDSGNQPTSDAFRAAVECADVLVMPVLNAGDSTVEALRLLEELRSDGGHAERLADNAIAVQLVDGRSEQPEVGGEVERVLHQAGVRTLNKVPYDPHIAERAQLTLASLAPATRDALTKVAANVIRALQTTVSTPKGS